VRRAENHEDAIVAEVCAVDDGETVFEAAELVESVAARDDGDLGVSVLDVGAEDDVLDGVEVEVALLEAGDGHLLEGDADAPASKDAGAAADRERHASHAVGHVLERHARRHHLLRVHRQAEVGLAAAAGVDAAQSAPVGPRPRQRRATPLQPQVHQRRPRTVHVVVHRRASVVQNLTTTNGTTF